MNESSGTGAPRPQSPSELQRVLELDRSGVAYLLLRSPEGVQREVLLDVEGPLAVGRGEECELALVWDQAVSRLHAELSRRAGSWLIVDDGLSRNGTYVNGERVRGRRRLRDGDVLRFGSTAVLFRKPSTTRRDATAALDREVAAASVSPAQRRVLIALCRPFADNPLHALPATNRQIADELVLGEDAVKSHLKALYRRFEIADLPHNAKRARLAELALWSGVVTQHDLK